MSRAEFGDQKFKGEGTATLGSLGRFRAPVIRSRTIERRRILNDELASLTLVCAPAGYGKTVAVAQWAQRAAMKAEADLAETADGIVWLRGAAIDSERPWEELYAALSTRFEAEARGAPVPGSEDAEQSLRRLIGFLLPNTILVIDNYERLTTSQLDLALADLIEQSDDLKIVVIGRRVSAFDSPLVRGRVRTQVIGDRALRFHDAEAQDLARLYGIFDEDAVSALIDATAGWPLAIQAVLSSTDAEAAQSGSFRSFEHAVGDSIGPASFPAKLSLIASAYLRLVDSEDARRVLFAVALCPGVSALTIAEVLLGGGKEDGSQRARGRAIEILRTLEDLGLLLRVWPPVAQRFECHSGLSAELRGQAEQYFDGAELDHLRHKHATDLATDDPFSSLVLLLELEDYHSTEALMIRNFADIVGIDRGLQEITRAIPSGSLAEFPVLGIAKLILGVFDEFVSDEWVRALVEELHSSAWNSFADGRSQSMLADTSALLIAERMLGSEENALRTARELERELMETPKESIRATGASYPFQHSLIGFTAALSGDFSLARRNYGRALELAQRMNSLSEQTRSTYGLALCACLQGEMRNAQKLAEQAKRLESEWNEIGPRMVMFEDAPVRALLAAAHGDEITVKRLRDELEPIHGRLETWPLFVVAEAESNRRSRGAHSAVAVMRSHLAEKTRVVATTHYLKERLTVCAAELQMMLGDLASAEQQLRSLAEQNPDRVIATARLTLLRGEPEKASRMLDTLTGALTRRHRCDYLLLSAVIAWQLGIQREARSDFVGAVRRMETTCGYGPLALVPYETLLALAQNMEGPGSWELLARVKEMPENLRCEQYEQLSSAELRTLEALAEGVPLDQTATQLFISLNTLKFHLRNIYRKLKVAGREEAVRRAFRMGLISPVPSAGGRAGGNGENRAGLDSDAHRFGGASSTEAMG